MDMENEGLDWIEDCINVGEMSWLHGRVGEAGRQAGRPSGTRITKIKRERYLTQRGLGGGRKARQELLPGKADLAGTDQ